MTISSVVPVNNYQGNGSTTNFDFDFLIENASELVVTKTDEGGNISELVLNVDYSIHEIGNTSGSYITFPLASSEYSVLSSSEVLTLSLDLDIKQESSFPSDIKLSLPVIERTFDYVVRLIQILNRKLERAIKVKESPAIDTESLVNNIDKIGINLPTLVNINSNISNINNVNSNETNINTLAVIDDDISVVANISENVSSVADNETNINTCAANISDITSAYSNAQTASEKAGEAGLSADNALASERLARDWATKTNGTVDGSEYSAKYYAIQARDESAITFAQLYANLGYERTALISDDRLYNCVYKYAHSTFDLSKFTVVGSPSVSTDGIASGFSSSNYLVSDDTIDFTKSFKIVFNEKKGTATKFNGFQAGVSGSESTPLFFIQASATNILTFGLYIGGTLTANDYSFAHADYTDINYIVSWDNTNYTLTVENAITHGTILTQTVASATALENSSSSTGVIVYGYNFNNAVAIQSTDLKQTYVKNNGQLLFSGNQTGIDNIFPATSYTIFGTGTTVDSNNIASGFTTTSGVKYNINYAGNSYNTFELYLGEYELSTVDVAQWFYRNIKIENGIYSGFQIQFNNANKFRFFAGSGIASNDIFNGQIGEVEHSQNAKIRIKLVFDGSNYTLYSSDNGGAWVQEYTKDTTLKILFPTEVIIGQDQNYFKGKINLNEIKTIIDGSMVFKLTGLSVPYTESDYGTPVVDVAYFDDVKGAYDYNGKAFYFIIDETNKKAGLPMGDIYGLMQKASDDKQVIGDWCVTEPTTTSTATLNKPAVVVENYLNGTEWYRVYSDGWCEQGGVIVPATEVITLNFLKPFKDTNYTILKNAGWESINALNADTAGFFTKTTTSARTYNSANFDNSCWYACGYIS